MGASISLLQQFFPSIFNLKDGVFSWPSLALSDKPDSDACTASQGECAETPADVLDTGSSDVEDAFNAMVYRSQMQQVSLSAQMSQVSGQVTGLGEDGDQSVSFQANQLTFDFFAESRVEELAVFQQRTNAVADGLEGTQRESFMAASQQVSFRFSMSLEITGVALNGYAGAAESLSEDSGGFDQFLGTVNDLLSKADEVLNQIFELLDGFFSGDGDMQTRFDEFVNGLSELGLLGFQDAGTQAAAGDGASNAEFQAYNFNFQMEFEFAAEYTEVQVQQADPLVLDLDGDGIELTSYADGARFDILGDDSSVQTAFVTGGDAFLAIDRNGNGSIDDGTELFGDQNGAAHGFAELAKFDSNHDGVINAQDDDFDKLLLWKDDGDGVTDEGELITLAEAGVEEISLQHRNVNQQAAGNNRVSQIASFLRSNGTRGAAVDALLNFLA